MSILTTHSVIAIIKIVKQNAVLKMMNAILIHHHHFVQISFLSSPEGITTTTWDTSNLNDIYYAMKIKSTTTYGRQINKNKT